MWVSNSKVSKTQNIGFIILHSSECLTPHCSVRTLALLRCTHRIISPGFFPLSPNLKFYHSLFRYQGLLYFLTFLGSLTHDCLLQLYIVIPCFLSNLKALELCIFVHRIFHSWNASYFLHIKSSRGIIIVKWTLFIIFSIVLNVYVFNLLIHHYQIFATVVCYVWWGVGTQNSADFTSAERNFSATCNQQSWNFHQLFQNISIFTFAPWILTFSICILFH